MSLNPLRNLPRGCQRAALHGFLKTALSQRSFPSTPMNVKSPHPQELEDLIELLKTF